MQKIIPFLWFNSNAEEAVHFYVSVFRDSKIQEVTFYGDEGAKASGMPKGSIMTMSFKIEGQDFIALNGGPQFTITPAISFVVTCKNQEEIDALWEKLSDGGEQQQCGWLKDRYGVSWQIVPSILSKMYGNKFGLCCNKPP